MRRKQILCLQALVVVWVVIVFFLLARQPPILGSTTSGGQEPSQQVLTFYTNMLDQIFLNLHHYHFYHQDP